MLKRIILISFLFTVGLNTLCLAQTNIPQDVKDYIKTRVDSGYNTSIVVGLIDATGSHYFSYGVKSLKTKESVDEHSVFEIGSISKTFTGILLANAVIKGQMKLDDPLQNYLPKGVTAPTRNGASIQLVNLSNHTSSLPRMPDNFHPANPNNPYLDYSEKLLYDFLTSYQLTRDIGSQYEYSNYGTGLLGHILATQNATTYEKLMVDVIAKPLDMKDTRIAFTPDMKKNLAIGHLEGKEVENWDFTTMAGAGAIRSTAVDMLKYVSANMGNVKSKLYPAMQLSHTQSKPDEKPAVGLGWHLLLSDNKQIVWHNGGTGGYRSFTGFIKGENKGVVVLTNSTESVDDIGIHLLNAASPLKPLHRESTPTNITVSDAILETYVGKYELAPGFVLTVTKEGSQLSAQATAQGVLPIFAKTENIFFYKAVKAELIFNKDDKGTIESVTLLQGGGKTTGKKIE